MSRASLPVLPERQGRKEGEGTQAGRLLRNPFAPGGEQQIVLPGISS